MPDTQAEHEDGGTKGLLPGSMESFQHSLRESISAMGLFPGGVELMATLPDRAIVCTYGPDGAKTHFSVAYSVDGDKLMVGAVSPVSLETVLVGEDGALPVEEEEAMEEPLPEMEMEAKRRDGMERKSFNVSLSAKAGSGVTALNGVKGWTFGGYASVWDIQDAEGDVVRKGAFARTLAEGLPIVKYEHGGTVGTVLDAREDDKGLLVECFVPEDQATEFMRKLMKIGAVAKMSYGWKPYPGGASRKADGSRELTDIRLFEVSPVAIPMLGATEITNVKSLPNGLPDAPFEVQLAAAEAVVYAARDEAEALFQRRLTSDRAVSEKCLDAVADFGLAAGEALTACLRLETKAGRAVSSSRRPYLVALMRAALAFVGSLPEGEKAELEVARC